MYTSYIDSGPHSSNDNYSKPMSPSTQAISRNHGTHMNPSKMKSSFIRQSFNFQNNHTEQYKVSQKHTQPGNLQQILNKKRQMRVSQTFQNPLQKIRKSQRRNGGDSFSKENMKRSPSRQLKNQYRYSTLSRQNSLTQSIFIDNKSMQDSMTLILKRLAKNQYQIQKLKKQTVIQNVKETNFISQLQLFKQQIKSLIHQNTNSELIKENSQLAILEQVHWLKLQLEQFKKDTKNQILNSHCQFKKQIDLMKIDEVITSIVQQKVKISQTKWSINFQSLQCNSKTIENALQNQIQKKLQNQIQKLEDSFQINKQQIQNKIKIIQQTQNQRQKLPIILKKSKKICSDAIQITYLEMINAKNLHNNLFSDRFKLLANVFNKQTELNNYQRQFQDIKYNKKQKNTLLGQRQNSVQFFPNIQETYYIDHDGFLLDKDFYYLTDENNNQIKIQEQIIDLLKSNGVII